MTEKIILADARNEIIDNLWIGRQPREPGEGISEFKFVLCLTGQPYYNIRPHQTVVVAPFDDAERMPPEDFINNLASMALKFSREGPTLVHCMAGINRSAMIVALALVEHGMSGKEAIALVREKRGPHLLYNKTFAGYIEDKG